MPAEKGLIDPLFLHELALELHMSKHQLGCSMPASELFDWAEFFAYRRREQERQEQAAENRQRRSF
jgi:hypothetical protein